MERRNRQRHAETPRLTCELCRTRKVKCDKANPCSNCVAVGVVCVPVHRPRLPRGIHARRQRRVSPTPVLDTGETIEARAGASPRAVTTDDNEFMKRISHLEELVDSMRSSILSPYSTPIDKPVGEIAQPAAGAISWSPSAETGFENDKALAEDLGCFWGSLDTEPINDFTDVMPAQSQTAEEMRSTPNSSSIDHNNSIQGGWLRVLGLASNSLNCGWPSMPEDRQITRQLCEVYLQQVDPVIKILHRPSLEKWMILGQQYLSFLPGDMAVDALAFSVRFAAAASLTEDQCRARFCTSRCRLVADTRAACESALDKSGLLASPSVTALQAFVLYLIARGCTDNSQAAWTLTAVAVRLAKALNLHKDADTEQTFFDQQMCRRLWLTVCLLDLKASLKQASEPIIRPDEEASTFSLPKNINDSDFDLNTAHEVPEREELTDTTFALVTYHLQLAGRALNFDAAVSADSKEARQNHAERFEHNALRLLHFCDPESSLFAWFTWHGTQCLVSGARLSSLRPLKRPQVQSTNSPAPSTSSHLTESSTKVLRLTLKVLEKAQLMHTDPRGEGFRWYVTIPWHAVATAVTESMACGDEGLIRLAWPIIEASYALLQTEASHNGLGNHGGIHAQLETLMAQGRNKLGRLLQQQASPCPSLAFGGSSAATSPRYSDSFNLYQPPATRNCAPKSELDPLLLLPFDRNEKPNPVGSG